MAMTTTSKPKYVLGILGVSVLALTACQTPADDQTEPDEGAQDVDPDGAEDQGDSPGEIAGEDDDEDDESPDDDTTDIPNFSEIAEEAFENSIEQDSATVTALLSGEILDAAIPGAGDAATEEPDDDADDEDDPEEEPATMIASGDMEGDTSHYQIEGFTDYVIIGEEVYQSQDSFITEYEMNQPEGADVPEASELASALEGEGDWILLGAEGREFVETPGEFLESFVLGFEQNAGPMSEVDIEGELDTRDGENVWVYGLEEGEEFIEFVVTADDSEPLLTGISYDLAGSQVEVTITEWNEAEEPDEPAEEDTISLEELEQIAESLL